MFRNGIKRAWLAVVRKPGKSILMGLILFAMANLICATIAINKSVDESVEYAKESLGGTVYLQADTEALREQMMSSMESGDMGVGPGQIVRPSVDIEVANEIADSEYVKDYSYSMSGTAKAVNFEVVESSAGGGGFMMRGMRFGDSEEEVIEADIQIQAYNAFAFVDRVQSNTLTYEGDYFDESTGLGVMISSDLALEAELEVGDSLKLQNVYTSAEIELEVIGIYTVTEDGYNANLMYTNIETAAQFLDEEQYADGNYGVQSVSYYVTNAEYSDEFIAEINEKYPSLADDGLALDIDESAYEQMVGPITSVGSFAMVILVVVIIASVVIVALIVTLNVRERRYEMGVLMSLGATRMNVLGSIFLELLIVGTVFFGLSIGTSTILAQSMGDSLLSSQLTMSEQEQANNFGRGNNAGRAGGPTMRVDGASGGAPEMPTVSIGGGSPFGGGMSNAEAIDDIDVSVGLDTYALLFATGYLVLLLAMIVPGANIMRYQPKEILSGKE